MKKNYLLIFFILIFSMPSFAQVPTYSNQTGGIGNAFPLNSLSTQRRVQWLIPAQSLGTLSAVSMITQVWFQAASNATQTYPVINVKLRSGANMTGLSGAVMEPSMSLVYTATNYNLSTTSGSWFTFTLQTPFLYDPNDPLIVELEHNATSGTGPSIYQTAITATAPTRQYGDFNVNTVSGSDMIRRINFGIEVVPACSFAISSSSSGTNSAAICSGNSLTLTTNAVSNYSWSTGATTSSIVVNPTSNTIYSLTATSSASCTATKAYTVNVSAASPVLTVAVSANTVCLGSTATLTANGALTYTWSNGAVNGASFMPASTSVYTVTGQNGCGISTATAAIQVGPLPVSVAASVPSVCAGSAAAFSVNAAANSFTWLPQNSVTQNSVMVVSPLANTVYTVTASDGTCVGTSTVSMVANPVPTVNIIATGSTVCNGSAVTMTASGGTSYTWTPASLNGAVVTDSPTANTLYQVSTTNNFGCVSVASQAVVIEYPPNMSTSFTSTNVCAGKTVSLSASGANSYNWSTGQTTSAITHIASTSTVITVVGGHATNTCVATKQFSINAISPFLSVTSPTALCMGAAATLTAGAGTNYSWSPSGGIFSSTNVSPTITTVYTVTANVTTSAVICPAQNTVTVTVNPLPSMSVTAQTTVVCKNQPLVLTASGAGTFSWSTSAQTGSITFSSNVVATHVLTVTGLNSFGCVSTGSFSVRVSQCTDISEINPLPGLNVYPVPSSGEIFIRADRYTEMQLINSLGEIISTISLNENNDYHISINDLAKGFYFIRSEDGNVVKKIVVE